jgi:DENN (AEX-3) domain
VGDDLGVVSGCVLALVNLLRPLRWAGPVIVTLPSSLHAYLESPVPLILGMQSLPEGFKLAPGIIMIDPKVRLLWSS